VDVLDVPARSLLTAHHRRLRRRSFLATWYGALLALATPDLRGQTLFLEVQVREKRAASDAVAVK
jgi:hypothetical protein